MNELDLLKQELFGEPDSAISDIKFYPGEGSFKASIHDIAGHTRAALEAIRDGNCRAIDLSI